MQTGKQLSNRALWVVISAATVLCAGFSAVVLSDEVKVTLSGSQEVPPLTTPASGTGIITVRPDKSVTGPPGPEWSDHHSLDQDFRKRLVCAARRGAERFTVRKLQGRQSLLQYS
jgi:hypothetical protein